MDQQLIEQVFKHLDRGHKVLFGSDHFGAVRIKVKHGFFNALTSHYRTDQETFNVIQERMADEEDESIDAGRGEPPTLAAVPPQASMPEARPLRDPAPKFDPVPDVGPAPKFDPLPDVAPAPRFDPFPDVAPLLDFDTAPDAAPPPKEVPPVVRKAARESRPRPADVCADFTALLAKPDVASTDQWKAYSQSYRQKRKDDRLTKRICAEEIESHRFALSSIDDGWADLLGGKIPPLAEDIWARMHPSKSVHGLADEVGVPLRECLFWLSVFKRYLDVWVENDTGTYIFRRAAGEADLRAMLDLMRRED